MTDPINVYLIKTTHSETPLRVEVDVQDYYTDTHVYTLCSHVDRSLKARKGFNLLTNDTLVMRPDVKIINVGHLDLWGWWNKMYLFSKEVSGDGINIYFDLDLKIQRDITWVTDFCLDDKITMLYSYWKPIDWEQTAYKVSNYDPSFKYSTLTNSSFMMWKGKQFHYIWEEYSKDPDKFMIEFRGNDDYMNRFHRDVIKVMPRGFAHSTFYGAEAGSEFFPRDKDPYKERPQYHLNLLNGLGKPNKVRQ